MDEVTQKIWSEFNNELKAFVLKKVKDKDIANDILQDVFLKIMDNANKISEAKNLQQYIYVIVRNTTIDHFRNNKRRAELEKNAMLTKEETESLNSKIADCCIKPFIQQLPGKYREALIKTEFENISQKELAQELNISYSGAKSRVQRGKEKLKELLIACCNLQSDKYGNLQPAGSKNCNC